MFAKAGIVAAAMLSASMVNAHMMMSNPVPYSKSTLNNSPLAADGSDFPCKLRDNAFEWPEGDPNNFEIGAPQTLSFVGSATHGGGSCQISLTTDLQPTKDSQWMVIKSYEGGCPANVDGNLSGGPDSPDPSTFNFTIPEGVAPGKYTLAWTWFNRIGNREMYMNCAGINVLGGSSKRSVTGTENKGVQKRSSFPPMFVANINGCMTTEGVDIRFPNPGDDLEFLGEAANLLPEGSTACSGTPSFGGAGLSVGASVSLGGPSGSSSSDAPAVSASVGLGIGLGGSGASSEPAAPAPEPTSSSAAGAQQSAAPGVFAPGASSIASEAPAAPTSEAAAPAASSSSSSSSSTSGALTGACSPEGDWNCIGGSSFQRCANGQWSVVQNMAAGTECTSGQSAELKIAASAPLKPRMISEMRHRRRAHGAHRA